MRHEAMMEGMTFTKDHRVIVSEVLVWEKDNGRRMGFTIDPQSKICERHEEIIEANDVFVPTGIGDMKNYVYEHRN